MLIQWLVISALCADVRAAYWGDIPFSREVIQLSSKATPSVETLHLKIQSQSLGRVELDLEVSRNVVREGLKRYTPSTASRTSGAANVGCFYNGWSTDRQYRVLLSSCSGRYRGSLSSSNDTWYFLFHETSYVIFPESDLPNPTEVLTAEHNGVELRTPIDRVLAKRDLSRVVRRDEEIVATLHRTLEVVVVTDRALWYQFDKKIEQVEEFALSTMYYIDEIYKQYGIRIALVDLEIWRQSDLISVTPKYTATLRNFTMYRQQKLLNEHKQHDVSILMTGVDFEGPVIGYAGVDTMCRSSCSNVNFNSRSNARFYATVIAHEIGHNFGMYHDSDECVCPPEEACIMSSTLGNAVTVFSNCSVLVLDSFDGTCLNNQPKSLYGDPVCGNGFVEEGEECDCGTEEECIASDPCCEPIGCKLKIGAECYTGECCDKCKFRSYKRTCRAASSECDLTEFCTGSDAQCPTNRYKQDGSDCGTGEGFCNYGSCHTRDNQCVSLWGEGASVAVDTCYSELNKKGEWYGNCGSLDNNKYIACIGEDVMCGKLFCDVSPWNRKSPLRNIYRRNIATHGMNCTVGSALRNVENKDIAMIYDGTKCSDAKWCIAGQCVEFQKVACPAPGGLECGGHGSCNDLNQCHCDSGYDPDHNCTVLLPVAGWNIKTILLVVMIIVLVVLPILITTLLVLRKYHPSTRRFLDQHTHIRFSIRLPSISRTASTIRRQSMRRKKHANKTAPPRPVKPPATGAAAVPARPPGSYQTAGGGWVMSACPPVRPDNTYGSRPSSSYYAPVQEEANGGSNYTPLRPAPSRPGTAGLSRPAGPSRPAPPLPSSRPASGQYDSPHQKSGPKAFQAGTRDNVKLDISGPEGARKLINDKPLDDRTLAGSPLMDISLRT